MAPAPPAPLIIRLLNHPDVGFVRPVAAKNLKRWFLWHERRKVLGASCLPHQAARLAPPCAGDRQTFRARRLSRAAAGRLIPASRSRGGSIRGAIRWMPSWTSAAAECRERKTAVSTHFALAQQKSRAQLLTKRGFRIGLQGLEPRIAVPETDVLPITP